MRGQSSLRVKFNYGGCSEKLVENMTDSNKDNTSVTAIVTPAMLGAGAMRGPGRRTV